MASDASAHLMFDESVQTLEHGKSSEYIRLLQNALKGGGIGVEMLWEGFCAADYRSNHFRTPLTACRS